MGQGLISYEAGNLLIKEVLGGGKHKSESHHLGEQIRANLIDSINFMKSQIQKNPGILFDEDKMKHLELTSLFKMKDKNISKEIYNYMKGNNFNNNPTVKTLFKEIYDKYGLLNTNFPLAADYELMLRLLYKHEISVTYIPRVLVKMRMGGISKFVSQDVEGSHGSCTMCRQSRSRPTSLDFSRVKVLAERHHSLSPTAPLNML